MPLKAMPSNAFVNHLLIYIVGSATACLFSFQSLFAQSEFGINSGKKELTLQVGEQTVLDAEGVRSFSEGAKGIIDIRLTRDNTQFVVVGVRPGETTLLFIMLDGEEVYYRITVIDPNAKEEVVVKRALVEARDNVRLDFYFVQLSNNYNHNLGIGWPGTIGGGANLSASFNLQTGRFTSASATISDQVLPRLDLAQSDGWAKIMRKAAVITANGTNATFTGGGEVNIPVTGGFGGSIKQINFGSSVGVKPLYDKETGRIELVITADVSDLADDNGTGVPGRVVSTLKTVVNLELGQSLVLAGLTAASQVQSQSGLAGLSQIPILGILFGSNASQISKTENLLFIIPSVIDTVSDYKRSLIREALDQYDQYSGDLDDVDLMPEKGRELRAK